MSKLTKTTSNAWGRLTKQHNIGSWVGGLKDIFTRALFYVTAINFLLLAATAYHTTLRDALLERQLAWMTFPVFIGLLLVLILVLMVVEYKLILPSTMAYLNAQVYKHENPIRRQLNRIEETLKALQDGTTEEK